MRLREAVKAAIEADGGLGSVAALARAADVDRSHLAHWLAGRREMETERIDRVLAAAGVRVEVGPIDAIAYAATPPKHCGANA